MGPGAPQNTRGPWRGNRRRLLGLAEAEGLDAIVLLSSSNILFATGIRGVGGSLILSNKCPARLLVPLLDYHRIEVQAESDIEVYAFYRGSEEGLEADIPQNRLIRGGLVEAVKKLAGECGDRIGSDKGLVQSQLAQGLGDFIDVAGKVLDLRAVKSEEEILFIKEAARIAEAAFTRLLERLEDGLSEAEAAAIIYSEMVSRGAWGEAFPTIAAFYDDTAYPHHTPLHSVRLGRPGPVLIDWGAIASGYRSDTTRTFWWGGGKAPVSFQKHLEAVEDAVNRALDVLAPGVEAWEVDNAARTALRRNGLSKYFIHGLGHGVGIDIHEKPYLRPGSKEELKPGMIVTIEPGIYLPGLYGIRIEELVEITPSGFRLITRLPRILPF